MATQNRIGAKMQPCLTPEVVEILVASVTGRLKMTDKVAEITETELRAMPA